MNERMTASIPKAICTKLEHWSPLIAKQLALEEGIGELTEAHWHVIYALRNLYREQGRSDNARIVMPHAGAGFRE